MRNREKKVDRMGGIQYNRKGMAGVRGLTQKYICWAGHGYMIAHKLKITGMRGRIYGQKDR